MPWRRALDAGQHQMNDVFGEIVLAGRDEDLGAGDLVTAVGLVDGLGPQQPEIGAALRLGEVHGPGPLAGHHLGQEHRLLFGPAVDQQGRGRAHGQPAIHRKRHVGGNLEFGDGLGQRYRQALPAILRRRRQSEPAAFGHLFVGLLETLRRGNPTIVVADAALDIADPIERLQHLFAEFGSLGQDRVAHIRGRITEARQIVIAVELKHVVEQKTDIFQGGFIARHVVLSAGGFGRASFKKNIAAQQAIYCGTWGAS